MTDVRVAVHVVGILNSLVYEKEQESREQIFHNHAKDFIFLRRLDLGNTF